MNFFERFLDPQQFESGGLPRRLESLLQEQAGYRPETGFAGWPQAGAMAGREAGAPVGSQPTAPQSSFAAPADQPTAYPAGGIPVPAPRPPDTPPGSIAIGDYMMPQFGRPPVSQEPHVPPDLTDRLGAGFRSWAHTPVGNPFAALANAITGFSSGQFASTPQPKSADTRWQPDRHRRQAPRSFQLPGRWLEHCQSAVDLPAAFHPAVSIAAAISQSEMSEKA